MAFDPKAHLTQIQGKDYLEVKWRLVWFREENPTGVIETEAVEITPEYAIFRATVYGDGDGAGRAPCASGFKKETPQGFADYIEKAETGAIGRALAALGYGTQFAPELEEGERLADSPVERPKPARFKQFNPEDSNAAPLVREARKMAEEHGLPDPIDPPMIEPPHPADQDDLPFEEPSAGTNIPEGGRHMRAKFAGNCANCQTPILEGDPMYYHRDTKAAYCTDCAPEGVVG